MCVRAQRVRFAAVIICISISIAVVAHYAAAYSAFHFGFAQCVLVRHVYACRPAHVCVQAWLKFNTNEDAISMLKLYPIFSAPRNHAVNAK